MTDNADNTRSEIEEIRERIDELRDAAEIAQIETRALKMAVGTMLGAMAKEKGNSKAFILETLSMLDEAVERGSGDSPLSSHFAAAFQTVRRQLLELALLEIDTDEAPRTPPTARH